MNMSITRTMSTKHYLYNIAEFGEAICYANYNFNILPLDFVVKIGNRSLEMRQKGGLICLIASLIPFLYSDSLFTYKIFRDNNCIGYSMAEEFGTAFYFHIESSIFEMRAHSNNMYSVLENDKQVALITKKEYSYFERNQYDVMFNSTDINKIDILLLICMFVDNRFHKDGNNSWNSYKWEKTVVLDDEYEVRTKWKPDS